MTDLSLVLDWCSGRACARFPDAVSPHIAMVQFIALYKHVRENFFAADTCNTDRKMFVNYLLMDEKVSAVDRSLYQHWIENHNI